MAKPWENKYNVMSDLDKLCDMYEPLSNVEGRPVKVKLLTEGRNPSPVIIDQVDYLIEDNDFSDTDCEKQPNVEFIAAMLRNITPSYSNDYIEQAYGNSGCLVHNPLQGWKEKVSSKMGNESESNAGEQNPVSDLNPCIKEFIPGEQYIPREELGSGDFITPSKNEQKHSPKKRESNPMTPEFNKSTYCSLNSNSPEFNHSQQHQFNPASPEVHHSPQHNLYHNDSEYNSLSPDTDNASILSLDSLTDSESYENMVESVTKDVPANRKENTVNSNINSAPLKASPLVDGKLKRNCALQSMFDRFAQGETQFNNIEVNRECFTNLGLAQSPLVISKPSDAMDQVIEISDDSIQNSYNSNQFVEAEDFLAVPSEPLQDVAGCLNSSLNKNMDTVDPKSKVAAWLSTDDSQRFATQQLNIVPSPKPKPINLCDDAFAFKVKNSNLVKGKTSAECTKNIAGVKQRLQEKEMDIPQPKGKMSVEEIYNRLKANQGKPTTIAPKTYETFVTVENVQQTSSNTLWDNIEKAMHKNSWNKKPKK